MTYTHEMAEEDGQRVWCDCGMPPDQCVCEKGSSGVCAECGISANVLTCLKKFGKRPNKLCYSVSTYHEGKCDICGESKQVTEARDFFCPDFTLLDRITFIFEE